MITVPFLKNHPDAVAPRQQTAGAAAVDLVSVDAVHIYPGQTRVVNCGISVAIPKGHVGLVCSRSGLAAKHGVFVLNAPGVIDEDYRGQIMVILSNQGAESPFYVDKGDRIAQLMILKLPDVQFEQAVELGDTARGQGGFGSTGTH